MGQDGGSQTNHIFLVYPFLQISSKTSIVKIKRPQLFHHWTDIADLLFSLSRKTFKISLKFHCAAFLRIIFDEMIDFNDTENDELECNPLTLFKPGKNKNDRVLLKIIENKTFCSYTAILCLFHLTTIFKIHLNNENGLKSIIILNPMAFF